MELMTINGFNKWLPKDKVSLGVLIDLMFHVSIRITKGIEVGFRLMVQNGCNEGFIIRLGNRGEVKIINRIKSERREGCPIML